MISLTYFVSSHSGVCHSDMGVMENSWRMLPFPTQPGQVGGHEGVGIVVKMGPDTDSSNVKVGDRVGIKVGEYAKQHMNISSHVESGLHRLVAHVLLVTRAQTVSVL